MRSDKSYLAQKWAGKSLIFLDRRVKIPDKYASSNIFSMGFVSSAERQEVDVEGKLPESQQSSEPPDAVEGNGVALTAPWRLFEDLHDAVITL